MKPDEVARTLRQLSKSFSKLLTNEGKAALDEAASSVLPSYDHFRKREADNWGYRIFPERPVRFQDSKSSKLTLAVDLFCDTRWTADEGLPSANSVVLRVWGLDRSVYYREAVDPPHIREKINPNKGRVMMKYRFDRALPGLCEPEYHLQTGGLNWPDEEPAWLHPQLEIPRLAHPPFDLTLACELAVANFLMGPEADKALRHAEWTYALRRSQEVFLLPYYEECVRSLKGGGSLYRSLWQKNWGETG